MRGCNSRRWARDRAIGAERTRPSLRGRPQSAAAASRGETGGPGAPAPETTGEAPPRWQRWGSPRSAAERPSGLARPSDVRRWKPTMPAPLASAAGGPTACPTGRRGLAGRALPHERGHAASRRRGRNARAQAAAGRQGGCGGRLRGQQVAADGREGRPKEGRHAAAPGPLAPSGPAAAEGVGGGERGRPPRPARARARAGPLPERGERGQAPCPSEGAPPPLRRRGDRVSSRPRQRAGD